MLYDQVKFVNEAFRRLRPGIPLTCLHGRMKQMQRMVVFQKYCEAKHALLFATDVAARGLDFPGVDWVVQVCFSMIHLQATILAMMLMCLLSSL